MFDPSHTISTPSISVVIPTRNRPQMVVEAVRSALRQTLAPLEVIVVIDGPETGAGLPTKQALEACEDSRVRVLALEESAGGGTARNLGVAAARGDWIAFLDDDDQWLPEKLATQMAFAATLPAHIDGVLSCPVIARSPSGDEVWPRVPYRAGQPMAEYLFCRRGLRYGSALLQTSTLLAPRALLLRIPFTAGLRKHQDWDWLLRVSAEPRTAVHMVGDQPLAIFHIHGVRASVSRSSDWRFSLRWAREQRAHFTDRAFAAFLVTECAAQAQKASLRERAALLSVAVREARLSPGDAARVAIFLTTPSRIRRWVADRVFEKRRLHVPKGPQAA